MAYKGSIELISGIKQKNNGTFPLVDATAVRVTDEEVLSTTLGKKADLVNGKIPAEQLPSYVDDVVEYANISAFPSTGESGKIYIATDTNLTYRWGGSEYVVMSSSLALGETSSTAYRGDRGKTAYDHSQLTTGNPHGVTKADVGLGNVPNVAHDDSKVDKVSGKGLSKNDFTDTLKDKLDSIEDGANAYVLPQAASNVLGGIKADSKTSTDTQDVRIGSDGKLYTVHGGIVATDPQDDGCVVLSNYAGG